MHQHDQLGLLARLERGLHRGRLDDPAPFGLDPMDLGAHALGAIGGARSEHAIDPDHDLVAILDQVGDRGFHPCRTGSRHRKGDFVIGAEDDAQKLLDILHQRHIFRVEMAQHRRRHRL